MAAAATTTITTGTAAAIVTTMIAAAAATAAAIAITAARAVAEMTIAATETSATATTAEEQNGFFFHLEKMRDTARDENGAELPRELVPLQQLLLRRRHGEESHLGKPSGRRRLLLSSDLVPNLLEQVHHPAEGP